MIEANELYILNELKELGIEKKKIREIFRRFAGWRIYFRKKQNEYEEIRDIYEQMIAAGASRSEAIKELADIFEKSESRIRIITAEQKRFFDEH
jgi:DNA-binding transcriptional regulator YhcF (GntR family)